ncbi:MAG: hypothetical protein K2X47_07055 [Bdellovibrionales bacterium]|nr:hypothetical protein [Bdellovibrionales bacterium]
MSIDSNEKNLATTGLIYDVSLKGHRPSYFEVFKRELGFTTAWGPFFKNLGSLISTPRLLSLTIDDYLISFATLSFLRAAMGKPTLGVSLRIENMFQHLTLKRWGKRLIYRLLLKTPGVTVCSLKPFFLEPRLSTVARAWIYDPQWWDLLVAPVPVKNPSSEIQHQLEALANSSTTLVVLPGHQSLIKGLEIFTQFAKKNPQFTCVCIGPNSDIPETFWKEFNAAGGKQILTNLSEEDLAWIYKKADVIWACYRTDYDQSSGIFGRALQRGKKVAIRSQSFLHHFAMAAAVENVLVVNEDGMLEAAPSGNTTSGVLQKFSPEMAREFSIAQIKESLGISS